MAAYSWLSLLVLAAFMFQIIATVSSEFREEDLHQGILLPMTFQERQTSGEETRRKVAVEMTGGSQTHRAGSHQIIAKRGARQSSISEKDSPDSGISVTVSSAVGDYTTEVYIGQPWQKLPVIIDTGSANFAVATATTETSTVYYDSKNSHTAKKTKTTSTVKYGTGSYQADVYTDAVGIGGFFVKRTDIFAIQKSDQFFRKASEVQYAGIMGMSWQSAAIGKQPLVLDALAAKYKFPKIVSLMFCRDNVANTSRSLGFMQIGRIDDRMYSGDIVSLNLIQLFSSYPDKLYFSVLFAGAGANNQFKLPYSNAILDSGTNSIILEQNLFQVTVNLICQFPQDVDLTAKCYQGTVEIQDLDSFPPLQLQFSKSEAGDTVLLEIPPSQYFRPSKDNQGLVQYAMALFPSDSSNANVPQNIIGTPFFNTFFVSFNKDESTVSIGQIGQCSGPSFDKLKSEAAAKPEEFYKKPLLEVWEWILIGVGGVIIVLVVAAYVVVLRRRKRRRMEDGQVLL